MRKTFYVLLITLMWSSLLVIPIATAKQTLAEFSVRCSFVASSSIPDTLDGNVCNLRVEAKLKEMGHWHGTAVFTDKSKGLRAVIRITIGARQGVGCTWILSGAYTGQHGPVGGGATFWENHVKIAQNIVFALSIQPESNDYYVELYLPNQPDLFYHWDTYEGQMLYTEYV